MEVFIVTGASKGIGQACFQQLRKSGATVIGIARNNPEQSDAFEEVDLTDRTKRKGIISRLLAPYLKEAASFTLINNAGTVEPIGAAGSLAPQAIEQAIELNLTVPIELSNEFLEVLATSNAKKQIVNISSGAGRNAYEGWGIYCATKAGLDRFSEVVRLEQQRTRYPVGIVSIAPGIIDTDMQKTIRSSDKAGFPKLDQFIDYKETGKLSSPEDTARRLLEWIATEELTSSDVIARLS